MITINDIQTALRNLGLTISRREHALLKTGKKYLPSPVSPLERLSAPPFTAKFAFFFIKKDEKRKILQKYIKKG
jgi:hypothetical protein